MQRGAFPVTSACVGTGESDEGLIEHLVPVLSTACTRWGPSRVGLVVSSGNPAAELASLRRQLALRGPCLGVAASPLSGMLALRGAKDLLSSGLTDAMMIVGREAPGEGDGRFTMLSLERQCGASKLELLEVTAAQDAGAITQQLLDRVQVAPGAISWGAWADEMCPPPPRPWAWHVPALAASNLGSWGLLCLHAVTKGVDSGYVSIVSPAGPPELQALEHDLVLAVQSGETYAAGWVLRTRSI